MSKAKVKSADASFPNDWLEIEAGQGDTITLKIATEVNNIGGRKQFAYHDITANIGDLQKALKRAGIELVS